LNTVITCVMEAVSFSFLMFFIFARPGFVIPAVRKFFIAASAVYLSGTLLLLIMSLFNKELPLVFVIAAEVSILSVYLVSLFSIIRITKHIKSIMQDVEDGKIKGADPDEDGEQKEDREDN